MVPATPVNHPVPLRDISHSPGDRRPA